MIGAVYRAELRKLRAQRRTYFGLIIAAVFAFAYVIVLNLVSTNPDVVYGDAVRTSGLVMPLVVLSYAAKFAGAALITGIVAGDIFSAEDQADTLKTILTRSARRSEIFAGKILAAFSYSLLALLIMGGTAVLAGSAAWGFQSFAALTGAGSATKVTDAASVAPWAGLGLVAASYAVYMLPLLGVVAFAILLSILHHNSAVAIVGTLLYAFVFYALTEALPDGSPAKPFLLGTHFDAWQALLHVPVDATPILQAAAACAVYVAVSLLVAWRVFARRDVAGA